MEKAVTVYLKAVMRNSRDWMIRSNFGDLLANCGVPVGAEQQYVEALVLQLVAESIASEQASRMVAMKAASDNAETLIDELTLIYNKNRQAAITKEISEIVGGAAAV